jgi:hypothetical protein
MDGTAQFHSYGSKRPTNAMVEKSNKMNIYRGKKLSSLGNLGFLQ